MDYNYYSNVYGGTCNNGDFEKYYTMAREIVGMYISKNIARWDYNDEILKDTGLYKAMAIQLDFLKSVGGIDGMLGAGTLALNEVTTNGYKYSYDRTNIKKNMILDGLPFSPITRHLVNMFLSSKGLLYRGIV